MKTIKLFILSSITLLSFQLVKAQNQLPDILIFNSRVTLLMPTKDFKGVLVYRNGAPSDEAIWASRLLRINLITPEVAVAHDYFTKTLNFYSTEFGRNGYDGLSTPVQIGVNVNKDLKFDLGMKDNAAWLEDLSMFVFGDGTSDRELENFVYSLEIVAHEFTHAVISSTTKLEYAGKTGALNEHFADVFGAMIRQYYTPETQNLFLIGDKALTAKGREKASALRDMMNPNKGLSWQPQSMSEIPPEYGDNCQSSMFNDNCGVHLLSGIPNKVSALIINKIGWVKARKLYYPVMTQRLSSTANFADYKREVLLECSAQLTKEECDGVNEAFQAVGL